MSERDPDAAWTHFNNRVRDKVEGEYGEFTNADWQAAVAMREEIKRLRSETPTEAGEWVCEKHPEMDWPHGDCAGPGMPRSAQVPQLINQRRQLRHQVTQLEGVIAQGKARIDELEHESMELFAEPEQWAALDRAKAEGRQWCGIVCTYPVTEEHEGRRFASPPPSGEPTEAEGARCICEWAHPVDGSIDPTWPAELDPTCPVHSTPTEPTEADSSRDLREAYSRYLQTVDGAPKGDLFRTIERIVGWGTNASNPTESEGVSRIARERARQVSDEGWTPEHDDEHRDAILSIAAAELAVDGTRAKIANPLVEDLCGSLAKFGRRGTKPDRVRALTIAGALIAAEIDRVLRLHTPTESRKSEPTEAEDLIREPDLWQVQVEGDEDPEGAFFLESEARDEAARTRRYLMRHAEDRDSTPEVTVWPVWIGSPIRTPTESELAEVEGAKRDAFEAGFQWSVDAYARPDLTPTEAQEEANAGWAWYAERRLNARTPTESREGEEGR